MNNRVNVKGRSAQMIIPFCFARGGETFLTLLPHTRHMVQVMPHASLPHVSDCFELMRVGKGQ